MTSRSSICTPRSRDCDYPAHAAPPGVSPVCRSRPAGPASRRPLPVTVTVSASPSWSFQNPAERRREPGDNVPHRNTVRACRLHLAPIDSLAENGSWTPRPGAWSPRSTSTTPRPSPARPGASPTFNTVTPAVTTVDTLPTGFPCPRLQMRTEPHSDRPGASKTRAPFLPVAATCVLGEPAGRTSDPTTR